MISGTTSWRDTGNTDFSSFAKALSRSVQPGASPMAAEARQIYDVLKPYGLTRLAAAMSWHERKNDSWGPAFGLDSTFCNPWAMRCNPEADACRNGWSVYSAYWRAANAWARRLTDPLGPYAETRTLADLVRVYAPASDGNDEKAYVQTLVAAIDALPLVQGGEMAPNPFPTPVIYDLKNDADAARFSLTPDERNRLLRKCIPGRNGKKPSAIVLHTQDGVTAGSLDWWANNAQASSTVLTNKDGSVVLCIPPENGPWTQGDVSEPTSIGRQLMNQYGPYPNEWCLSVEAEGRPNDPMSEAHLNAICWVVRGWMDSYDIPLERVVRHADLNQTGRSFCPGPYYTRVMERLQSGGPTALWPNKPTWMPDSLVLELFPEAAPGGIRTNAWFRHCTSAARAPRRVKIHYPGTVQELIEFSDGTLIDRAGKRLGAA